MSKAKPDANDLRRLIGYTMITFMSVFISFVVILTGSLIVYIGVSPSGKAPDFDSGIRWFESSHPSQ